MGIRDFFGATFPISWRKNFLKNNWKSCWQTRNDMIYSISLLRQTSLQRQKEPWQINSNATLKIQETDFAARSAGRCWHDDFKLAWEAAWWQMTIMRSIAKSYVSERLCLEPLYKERIIQRVSNRYNLKQNSRRNKKKPSSLFWTGANNY